MHTASTSTIRLRGTGVDGARATTFTCTAQGDDGLTYDFTMQITSENEFAAHGDHARVPHRHDRSRPFTFGRNVHDEVPATATTTIGATTTTSG